MQPTDNHTPEQWSDALDWYQSGIENGLTVGYRQGFADAYNLALRQWCDTITDQPHTAFLPRCKTCPASTA